MSKKIENVVELYRDFRLRSYQQKNILKIANSPLPEKKLKKFSGLVVQYNIRLMNAREKFRAAFKKLSLTEIQDVEKIVQKTDAKVLYAQKGD